MGYRVEYFTNSKKNANWLSTTRICTLTVLAFYFFSLTVAIMWPEGFRCLENTFCSIKKAIPVAAMNEFADNLQTGEQLSSAFAGFVNNMLP